MAASSQYGKTTSVAISNKIGRISVIHALRRYTGVTILKRAVDWYISKVSVAIQNVQPILKVRQMIAAIFSRLPAFEMIAIPITITATYAAVPMLVRLRSDVLYQLLDLGKMALLAVFHAQYGPNVRACDTHNSNMFFVESMLFKSAMTFLVSSEGWSRSDLGGEEGKYTITSEEAKAAATSTPYLTCMSGSTIA